MRKITLVYDCLRAPYDIANILQVALAVRECDIHITGNSLRHDHRKVVGKVKSWSERARKEGLSMISVKYHKSLVDCLEVLKKEGLNIIGTSPCSQKSFFDLDLKSSCAIVFGTESGGLSKDKMSLMDNVVKIPMSSDIDFMTLSVVTPVVVYEILRQRS